MAAEQHTSSLSLAARILFRVILAPWYLIVFIFRLLYRFHIENPEKLPSEGPGIFCMKEPSLMGMFPSGYIAIKTIVPMVFRDPPTPLQAYMRDQLFSHSYMKNAFKLRDKYGIPVRIRPLTPHAAGKQALYLLEGVRCLQNDGLILMNPEGIGTWDGLPVPLGKSSAWLALHSGAPIIPAICTMGAYENWPSWQSFPSLRGRLAVRVGDPLYLSEGPMENVTDDDLVEATEKISEVFNRLSYGEGGIEGWVGTILQNGKVLDAVPEINPPTGLVPPEKWSVNPKSYPLSKRRVSLLLWRCPVCKVYDALDHERPWFRQELVRCQSCRTVWEFERIPYHDFRMRVIEGAPELVGLDMPLSIWNGVMKEGFKPVPVPAEDIDLVEGEEAYLQVDGALLKPHKPNQLFEDWEEQEAPKTQPQGQQTGAERVAIGAGKLTMTNKRLQWKGDQRIVDFYWTSVQAVHNWEPNVLGIVYGRAQYDIPLANEIGLKWVSHAGEILKHLAETEDHEYTISPY